MPSLTIFTAPKPFSIPHIDLIQRNALLSWKSLGAEVEVILVGDETGMAQVAAEYGLRHIPGVACNTYGTPLLSDIFAQVRQASQSSLLAYANADILLMPDFLKAAHNVANQASSFLVVGQRFDLEVTAPLDYSPGWDERLRDRVLLEGRLHPPAGSDYFLFPRHCFTEMPAFAVGRPTWDNWMIYHALRRRWPVIDATDSIKIAHQNHDYSHLPGGQPHYRLPEAHTNLKLAGGRRRVMSLRDASHVLVDGKVRRALFSWARLWRTIETFPVLRLDSYPLAEVFFALFHPTRAWGEWRGRLAYKLREGLR